MDGIKRKIIGAITKDLSDRFRVIDNTGTNKRIIAEQFPDVLLMRQEPPKNDDILFIMRIETPESDLIDSVTEWKEMDKAPIASYIVVSKDQIDEAKKLASVVGIHPKFAVYTFDHNQKASIDYE